MKIYYYDLGVYNGKEIDIFIDIANSLGMDYEVIGFEAFPEYASILSEKYKSNPKVTILNLMISDRTGLQPLYISTGAEGHSKYAGKKNCTEKSVMVAGTRFSEFVDHEGFKSQFNIIRFNIEGAEWDFINDMIDSGLYKFVKIWLGAREGEDILKCKEIKHLYPAYIDLLREHGINIHRFIYWSVEKNADLGSMIQSATR